MTAPEIREYLNLEYKKWNIRTTNKDPNIVKEADEMLMRIAMCRKKHF